MLDFASSCSTKGDKRSIGAMASEDQKEHDVSTLREQDESENASYVCLGERDPRWVISGEVAGILYRHQREGIRWLWGLQKRGQGGMILLSLIFTLMTVFSSFLSTVLFSFLFFFFFPSLLFIARLF